MLHPDQLFSSEAIAFLRDNMPKAEVVPSVSLMNDIIVTIQDYERPIRKSLERTATSIVYNNFPVFLNNKPHVKVKAKLVDYILPPEEDGGRKAVFRKELMDEYRKRKLINMITQGAGISTHGIHHVNDAFKQQYPELIEAYDVFDKHNRAILRLVSEESAASVTGGQMESARILGVVKTEFSHGRWVIVAEAIMMPVLIHEVVKGMYELLAMDGLPKDNDIRADVLEFTDTKANELIDLKYGEVVYPMVRDAIRGNFHDMTDERPEVQEYYLQHLYQEPPLRFIDELEGMFLSRLDTKRVRSIREGILRDLKRDDNEA